MLGSLLLIKSKFQNIKIMSFEPIQLKQAPQDFIPNCDTHHDEVGKVMRQWFKGGRVRFNYYKTTGMAEALVDGRTVGTWKDVTVGMWGNILYTLQTEFNHLIEQ